MPSRLTLARFAVSPCSNPELGLDDVLPAYAALGYCKFEVFTQWAKSAFDFESDPGPYLAKGRQHGLTFISMHLPPVGDDRGETLDRAVRAARFAKAIGAEIVLFKATSRRNYIEAAPRFLEAIDGLGITPVLQNHVGAPISSLADFREVIEGIGDSRMRTLLEVGMFHSIGVGWRQGYDLLGDSIALVHIKDQVGETRVPFGEGEVDLPGLFRHLETVGYGGDIVVEMEVCRDQTAKTLELLGKAREHIRRVLEEMHR